MVFSNAVFLFAFLPITLLGYYLLRGRARNYWLLLVSLFFYAWNKPEFLTILLVSIAVNYLGALSVSAARKRGWKRCFLTVTVAVNLGLLYYFKYFNFTVEILQGLLRRQITFTEVVLPIGISFFTFQGLSYVVDVFREEVPAQRNIFKLGMYISLFPQLVAGPIVRYKDVAAEIDSRSVTLEDFSCGVQRFILGLFKKIILADILAVRVDAIYAADPGIHSAAIAWLGILCYSLQLFFDFAGYSDMAIGMGRMFGFHFMENFNYPYISRSVTEFWRRWHIALSTFFRDYVYIPLGGNRAHVYRNIAIVFLLTGIWHGAAYTFIIWGIWHGVFNLAERLLRKQRNTEKQTSLLARVLQHGYTLLVVVIGWVFFRSESLEYAWKYLLAMFGLYSTQPCPFTVGYYLDRWTGTAFVLALLMSTPLLQKLHDVLREKLNEHVFNIGKMLILLGMLVLCVLQVASNTYSAFIYFQF